MNYKFLATKIDKDFIAKNLKQEKSKLEDFDFSNAVIYKPWGQEYLINEDIPHDQCIWILHFDKSYGTSLHCHKYKDTILYVLSGQLLFGTIKGCFLVYPSDKIFIGKKVFHTMSSNDAIVMEVESTCDKLDSIRLTDQWNRKGKPYEAGCKVVKL